jgi:hypothetical protein
VAAAVANCYGGHVMHKFDAALRAAIDLSSQGYACFPCRLSADPEINKSPACKHGFKDARTDELSLRRLWRKSPGALVGVATGLASRASVLDIDRKHPEAWEWWAEHRERLLPTRVHRTSSGGLHLVFRHLDGIKNSTSKINKGVDTRGDGGYFIWWPATGLPVLCEGPIKPWPDWLCVPATPSRPRPSIEIAARRSAPSVGSPHATMSRLMGLLRMVATANEGNRNSLLFWATCRVRDMSTAGALDGDEAQDALDALHEAARRTGLNPLEINRSIVSAMRPR